MLGPMRERPRLRVLPLAGMAAAGTTLGHWLSYRLAVPDAHARAHLLAQTGHGYWLLAVKGAVVLGLSGSGAFFVRHLRSRPVSRSGPVESYARMLVPLAALQFLAFTAMEVAERSAAGAPLYGLFQHHLFLLGLAIQFLVACAGGWCSSRSCGAPGRSQSIWSGRGPALPRGSCGADPARGHSGPRSS